MTDLKLLQAPSHETMISQNLRHMQRARTALEVRQVALCRSVRKIENRLSHSDDFDEVQNLHDILDNLGSLMNDLELFRSNLEKEVDKVHRGLAALQGDLGVAGYRALGAYITEDTNLSIENVQQVGSYYDQVLETMRHINDEPLGY